MNIQQIKKQIGLYYSDMNRPKNETTEGLEELVEYIDQLLEMLYEF